MLATLCFYMYKKLSSRKDSADRQSLRRSRSFKVNDIGTNQKPMCDFLSANNTDLRPISHRCQVWHSIDQIIGFDRDYLSLINSYQKPLRILP